MQEPELGPFPARHCDCKVDAQQQIRLKRKLYSAEAGQNGIIRGPGSSELRVAYRRNIVSSYSRNCRKCVGYIWAVRFWCPVIGEQLRSFRGNTLALGTPFTVVIATGDFG